MKGLVAKNCSVHVGNGMGVTANCLGLAGAKESKDGARSKRIDYRLHQLQAS